VLAGWLDGLDVPGGLAVDTDLRWSLLYRLVVLGSSGEPEIRAELARDPSAQGTEHAAMCRAAIGTPAAKKRAWSLVAKGGSPSVRLTAATAAGFWHPEQAAVTDPYVERYFAELPALAERQGPSAVAQIARAAYPRYAVTPRTLDLAHQMLARDDLDPVFRRITDDATDDLRRSLTCRAAAIRSAGPVV
ncbi:MAG: Membrane alanyl aminopeptidase, partial [Actinomycetia bacterium]|nr:Membrane alanyl aminopeptidase [Actinomycetes bacterium]